MEVYIEPIGRLINEFSKLPGVGRKSAQRYAYKVISMTETEAQEFAAAIINVKKKVRYCKVCGNFTENEVCTICAERDKRLICVVKEPKDVIALEKLHEYKGVYHVLHGVINPMEGVGPNDIRIRELLARVNEGSRHQSRRGRGRDGDVHRKTFKAAGREMYAVGARHSRGVGDRIYRRHYTRARIYREERSLNVLAGGYRIPF